MHRTEVGVLKERVAIISRVKVYQGGKIWLSLQRDTLLLFNLVVNSVRFIEGVTVTAFMQLCEKNHLFWEKKERLVPSDRLWYSRPRLGDKGVNVTTDKKETRPASLSPQSDETKQHTTFQ